MQFRTTCVVFLEPTCVFQKMQKRRAWNATSELKLAVIFRRSRNTNSKIQLRVCGESTPLTIQLFPFGQLINVAYPGFPRYSWGSITENFEPANRALNQNVLANRGFFLFLVLNYSRPWISRPPINGEVQLYWHFKREIVWFVIS